MGPHRQKAIKEAICRVNYRDLMYRNSIGPILNPKWALNFKPVILLMYEFMAKSRIKFRYE
ncbi:hypothetical protein NBRC116602_22490 [Hyphomicrobiales bacterium 4NK60-0047b]